MKRTRMMAGLVVSGILAIVLLGCFFLKENVQLPTAPVETISARDMANFYTSRDVSAAFEWNRGEHGSEVFCVNIPQIGEYALSYTTLYGTFHIVFRANLPAYLYIGLLENDVVSAVTLQRGMISETAAPLLVDQDVTRYATPHIPEVVWTSVFTPEQPINLPEGQGECRVMVNTKKAF